MTSRQKNIDNKSNHQSLIMQATIDGSRQDTDEKMKKQYYKLGKLMVLGIRIINMASNT